jgi:SagB-type dehydrogenase family enzyme
MTSDVTLNSGRETLALPTPRLEGGCSIESALHKRRSVRAFGGEALTLAELAQVLWAAQGVVDADGGRTAPSAGALYPLEVYAAAGRVAGLPPAVYKYLPKVHRLQCWAEGDRLDDLASAAWNQPFLKRAAAVLVFAAVDARTTAKYGERGIQYVHIEIGHAAQNALLQATALGLCAVPVGAFDEREAGKRLQLPRAEGVRYLLPLGKQ